MRPTLPALLAVATVLGGAGDPARGRAVVADRTRGLCTLCHNVPGITGPQGDIGPGLAGVGARMTLDELRARVADPRGANPETIMPAFGTTDGLTRVARPADPVAGRDRRRRRLPGHGARMSPVLPRRAAALLAVAVLLRPRGPARATEAARDEAVRRFTGGAEPRPGRVSLEMPPLVENGNAAALSVRVDSPMTPEDHVRRIAVFNEANPQPEVLVARFGPAAARAGLDTRIRLANSQTITAVAELSDGSFWSATAEVIVTLAACVEGSG